LLAGLRARPEVRGVAVTEDGLTIDLQPGLPNAPLVRLMVEAGTQLEEIRRSKASLEELFLKLVEEEGEPK
jgi:ABC-2 type transport system ATP-binding protein